MMCNLCVWHLSIAGMVKMYTLQPVQHSTDCQGYVSSYKQHSVMHIGSMSCGVSFMFLGTSCGTATLHAVPNSRGLYTLACICCLAFASLNHEPSLNLLLQCILAAVLG